MKLVDNSIKELLFYRVICDGNALTPIDFFENSIQKRAKNNICRNVIIQINAIKTSTENEISSKINKYL